MLVKNDGSDYSDAEEPEEEENDINSSRVKTKDTPKSTLKTQSNILPVIIGHPQTELKKLSNTKSQDFKKTKIKRKSQSIKKTTNKNTLEKIETNFNSMKTMKEQSMVKGNSFNSELSTVHSKKVEGKDEGG
eukprot:CAMPEP_0116915192 /NCGR_PEP_ID=MMETSP0467-20121206/17782_1 /TAXON_ID=283647 /ORGANISM="Mesodinium pulex, Strain SPMC105" /LENGTH=131 /DNA_ID=CAMNT_0004591809 /DNA_START=246 /DNA_END=641 /DNA_ORIENTATION=-